MALEAEAAADPAEGCAGGIGGGDSFGGLGAAFDEAFQERGMAARRSSIVMG